MALLFLLDVYFINHAYHNTLIKGPSVQLVFGFEYAILMTAVVLIFVKYILHAVDLQSENPWENKAVYLLYTELILGGVKVGLYFLFLAIMIKVHTFPLFAIRPMYLTVREFRKALSDVVMSRRAIRNMNTLYADATAEEIASGDNVCIICREEMHTQCKKLPCNHIFHTSCLRSWFQRQQTCPTCRMDVLRPPGATVVPPAAANLAQHPPVAQPFAGQVLPPFAAGPFQPMWQPPNMVPPPAAQMPVNAQAQQPPSSAAQTSSASTPLPPTYTAPVGPPQFAMPMPPPFGMPFWFPPPMPVPPPNFSGLTMDELRAMEGSERQAVEARIQCLRDIQTLLNAAMLQLQQYNSVAGTAIGAFNLQSHGGTMQPGTSAPVLGETTTTSVLLKPCQVSSEVTSVSSSKSLASSVTAEPEGATGYSPPKEEKVPQWEDLDNSAAEDDSEIGEIRRRRLQRFSSTNLKSMDES
jgi:E3 ubiquitin-protein ligase synoviolin